MSVTTCPQTVNPQIHVASTQTTPAQFPFVTRGATICGHGKAYRNYAGENEIPISAQPITGSPHLIVSDEPEQIVGESLAGNVVLYKYSFNSSEPFTGIAAKRFRILLYHWNNSGDTRRMGLYLKNTGTDPITLTCIRGDEMPLSGDAFAEFAAASLDKSLRTLVVDNPSYTPGTAIAKNGTVVLIDKSVITAPINQQTGQPEVNTASFCGALVEITVESLMSLSSPPNYSFEILSVVTADDATAITAVGGNPYVLPDNCVSTDPPTQEVWLGHPRGDWPHSGIKVPFADPQNEAIAAIDDEEQWVQFTIGQTFVQPYGGDALQFEGSTVTPYGRSNRILFAVDQEFIIPIENTSDSEITVRGYLLSLARSDSDSKLFAGLINHNNSLRNIRLGGQGQPLAYTTFANAFEVDVPAAIGNEPGKRTATFKLQVGAASSGPIALMIQNAGTTSTTTTSTTSTTTEDSTTSSTETSETTETSSSSSSSSTTGTTETSTESTTSSTTLSTTTLSSTSSTTQTATSFTDTLSTMPTRPPS